VRLPSRLAGILVLSMALAGRVLATGFCADTDARHAKSRLRQLTRQLLQYTHRLRSLKARKTATADVRQALASTGDRIAKDVATLRHAAACPADAA